MKVYLSHKQNENPGYTHVSDIRALDSLVLNKQATKIVVDGFLTSFTLKDISTLIDKIVQKMRIGCELTITDTDVDLLCLKHYRGEIDIDELNDKLSGAMKSLVNLERIESIIESKSANLQTLEKFIDHDNLTFIFKARRVA